MESLRSPRLPPDMHAVTATPVEIGAGRLCARDVTAIARDGRGVLLAPACMERIRVAQRTLEAAVAQDQAIYGVSTGLGAAVDTRVTPGDAEAQRAVVLARAVGTGQPAPREAVRAMMAARLAGLAAGRSGASPQAAETLALMLNRGVHPVVPMLGSVGEADLAPLAHIACVLVGAGEAEWGGQVLPGAAALARAGIAPPGVLGLKDGLALVSSNAASIGPGALVVRDCAQALDAALCAAALSLEGYRASLAPLDPRAAQLRPAPGQAEAAQRLLALLDGSDLVRPGSARRLQDPLSLRCLAPVLGSALAALAAAEAAVELELNAAGDNPAILAEDDAVLANANFDPTHLALAFEALGLALARVAALAGARLAQLMSPASSSLPRFLAVPPGRNGFATLQKTVSALVAEVQHRAAPMPVVALPSADGVEDYATMAPSIVAKTGAVVEGVRSLVAIELLMAAQACDLRDGVALGRGTGAVRAAVRRVAAPLGEDRPAAPDVAALDALIRSGALDGVGAG